MNINHYRPGWWLTYPSEKYESNGIIAPQDTEKCKMFQTTNQITMENHHQSTINMPFNNG